MNNITEKARDLQTKLIFFERDNPRRSNMQVIENFLRSFEDEVIYSERAWIDIKYQQPKEYEMILCQDTEGYMTACKFIRTNDSFGVARSRGFDVYFAMWRSLNIEPTALKSQTQEN